MTQPGVRAALAPQRHASILEAVATNGAVRVSELTELLGVSEIIRPAHERIEDAHVLCQSLRKCEKRVVEVLAGASGQLDAGLIRIGEWR